MIFTDLTWPEVARVDRGSTLALIPIASCEQHSHHLATFTDSILVGAVAQGVEAELAKQILLLPVQWLGASDHHLPFGATLTASVDHHIDLVADIAESLLTDGFTRLLVLNGHGGNTDTMRVALRRLQPRFPNALLASASYWDLASGELAQLAAGKRTSMGHACEFETSMMLHLRPDMVRKEQIKDFHPPLNSAERGLVKAQDFSQMSEPGCIGYPTLATAEKGKRMLTAAITRTVETCRSLLDQPLSPGRQRQSPP